jgi:hypothetical protein
LLVAFKRQKHLNLLKLFKTGEIATVRFSNVVGAVLPTFQKRIVSRRPTYLPDFKTGEIASCRFSKALGATSRYLSSSRCKGFELGNFEKLSAKSKAFGTKRLRTYNLV